MGKVSGIALGVFLGAFLWALIITSVACATGYCVATFCGVSSECGGDCICVVNDGEATGYCASVR